MANLNGFIRNDSGVHQLGERFSITLEVRTLTGPSVFALFLNAVIDIYDASGNHVLVAAPYASLTNYRDSKMVIVYMLATGPAKTLTQAGQYKYVYTLTLSDGTIGTFEQQAILNPNPF